MNRSIRFATRAGILAAISTLLTFCEFPVLFMPAFLSLDISDVPVLIGTLLLGWPSGVAVALIKNLLRATASSSLTIGEIANFSLSVTYITVLILLRRTGLWAYMASTVALAAMAVLLNFWVLLPLYQEAFHITTEQLLSLTRAAGNPVLTIWDFMWWVIVPFNLIKGALIAVISVPIYRRLRHLPQFQK